MLIVNLFSTIPLLFLIYSFQVLIIKISHFKHITNRLITLFSYKISLIKCLIDRSFKICNSWNSFLNDKKSIKSNLIKNPYLPFLIDKVIKKYLHYKLSSKQNRLKDPSDVHYFKLLYTAIIHTILKINFQTLQKSFVKKTLALSYLIIDSRFSYKDLIPNDLKSFLMI